MKMLLTDLKVEPKGDKSYHFNHFIGGTRELMMTAKERNGLKL